MSVSRARPVRIDSEGGGDGGVEGGVEGGGVERREVLREDGSTLALNFSRVFMKF